MRLQRKGGCVSDRTQQGLPFSRVFPAVPAAADFPAVPGGISCRPAPAQPPGCRPFAQLPSSGSKIKWFKPTYLLTLQHLP